jgi:hypothetical protein
MTQNESKGLPWQIPQFCKQSAAADCHCGAIIGRRQASMGRELRDRMQKFFKIGLAKRYRSVY